MLEDDTSILAKRLKELRLEMGWTLEDVATITGAAARGVPGNWELNRRTPPHGTLALLARWYGVSLDYLYGVRGADRESPPVRLGRAALRDRFPQAVRDSGAFTPTARLRLAIEILQSVAPEAFFPGRMAALFLLSDDEYAQLLRDGEASAAIIERFSEVTGLPVRWFYVRPDEL